MSLHLTPEMLEASYELLRTTPPFKRWKLPEADDVEFFVTSMTDYRGAHVVNNGRHQISISSRNVGSLDELNRAMAHEMIHEHEEHSGKCRADVHHGRNFARWARSVCQYHCWDVKAF